ncbi:Mms22p [Saccharomyces paradoxus]|uniref:Mms22p n=1 Tax=Saccharomyces paradoxus TaxID=27291 RepID=A0A8B8UWB8_SACPA|nr:Mms22 [Saccharomyces paradoxus]QHS75030.1 Mms22 [Saccharomyces paradoxus]
MDVDEPNPTVISDSEAADEEISVIYRPEFNEDYFWAEENVQGTSRSQKIVNEGLSLDSTAGESCPPSVIADTQVTTGLRWSLRKRKAIQKMPYSLERIKHRQLLEGYDITSFDTISNQLILPNNTSTVTHSNNISLTKRTDKPFADQESVTIDSIGSENDSIESQRYDSDEEIPRKRHRNSKGSDENKMFQSDDSIENEQDFASTNLQDAQDDEVIFRGRVLNVKTGYRGVLPRVAWEKSLQKQQSSKVTKRKTRLLNHKGVARRKINKSTRIEDEEQNLLSDLIAPDDEQDIEEDAPPDIYLGNLSEDRKANERELKELQEYYESKYSEDEESARTSGFNLNGGYRNEPVYELEYDGPESCLPHVSYKDQPIIYLNSQHSDSGFSEQYDISGEDNRSVISLDAAEEHNDGIIDKMLVKAKRNKSTTDFNALNAKRKKVRRYKYKYHNSCAHPTTRAIKVGKRSAHKSHLITNRNPVSVIPKGNHVIDEYLFEPSDPQSLELDENSSIKSLKKKKKKKKTPVYPSLSTDLELRRKPVFNTVIEIPTNRYAFTKPNVRNKNNINYGMEIEEEDINHELGPIMVVLDSILLKKPFEPPNFVKIQLPGKSYSLSKLNPADIAASLRDIFRAIIDRGITDTELVHFNESLVTFLVHLDMPELFDLIGEFHREFRSKVNSLRKKAKPIHFFQIATCQLMFLEISRYNKIPAAAKLEMDLKLVDHIVSFFKLLSVCYDSVMKNSMQYLYTSYYILSAVVDIIHKKEALWDLFQKHPFLPQISLLLVNIFPTKHCRWQVLRLDSEFQPLNSAFRFINYCIETCNWNVTNSLILSLDRIFKKRRFSDFEEEAILSQNNKIIFPPTKQPASRLIFNKYLHLLTLCELSSSDTQRVIPMGEISMNDSLSVLKNRLNLLIVLATHFDLNLEKRFQELTRPLYSKEYLDFHAPNTVRTITTLIMQASLSFLEISRDKNHPFSGKFIASLFGKLVLQQPSISGITENFLKEFIPLVSKMKRKSVSMLKLLYPSLVTMSQERVFEASSVLLLEVYLKSLDVLGPAWVQNYLLQFVKTKAQENKSWIEYYCRVGKFLVDADIFTWWTFFTYNGLDAALSFQLAFYSLIIDFCDADSFELLRKPLYSIASDLLLISKDNAFYQFLSNLLKRAHIIVTDLKPVSDENELLRLVSVFSKALKKNAYQDILSDLLSMAKKHYDEGDISKNFLTRYLKFLNKNCLTELRNNQLFISLRRELGISSDENEKCGFWDSFNEAGDMLSKAAFVETGIVQACCTGNEIDGYLENLSTLFTSAMLESPFTFFSDLVIAHIFESRPLFDMNIKNFLLCQFINLFNKVLRMRFEQVSPDEFAELCKVYRALCIEYATDDTFNRNSDLITVKDTFLASVLRIADGFWEYDRLSQLRMLDSDMNIPNQIPHSNIQRSLSAIVIKVIERNIGKIEASEPFKIFKNT